MKSDDKGINQISYLLISFHYGISTLSDLAVQFFLKDTLELGPGNYSKILSISLIPWMLKPFQGLLSDLVPIFGYRRKSYIILCGILDIICWILMAFYVEKIWQATTILFIINLCLSFSTVLGEAIVVELSKTGDVGEESSNNAKDNISLFFVFKNIGILTSSYLKGYLIDIISIKSIFLLAAVTPIIIIISGIIMHEEPYSVLEKVEDEDEKPLINRNLKKEFLSFFFQKQVIIPIVFIILFMAPPSYDDPLFYFLTNELKFNGNILGQMSFAAALTAIIAVMMYKEFFKHVSFRKVLVVGSILYTIFSFTAYALVTRMNVKIGVSDYLLCLFSSSTTNLLAELVMMPILSLACLLCPKNLEATVYSVFMSSINFGAIISYLEASYLTNYLGITSSNFENLPKLITIANITGLMPLVFLYFVDEKYFSPKNDCNDLVSSVKEEV